MTEEIIVRVNDKLLVNIAGKIYEYTVTWDDCYKPPVINLSGTYIKEGYEE